MRKMSIGMLGLCFLVGWVTYPHFTLAEVEWRTLKELDLKADTLDIFQSPDGQLLFILTRGEVLIYSPRLQNITDKIPVDKEFDRISYSPQTKTLTLSSSTKKKLLILSLEFIQKIDTSGLPYKGPENSPVTLVVFSDYQWPYCARLEPVIQQVLDKYPKEAKLVIKHYPLPSHPFAGKAAIAALAAHKQGKFWEFHSKLFAAQSGLNEAKIQEIAKEIGLNLERFNQDLSDPRLRSLVEREISQARQADIRGVPAIFVNGKLVPVRGFQDLQVAVENELRKKK